MRPVQLALSGFVLACGGAAEPEVQPPSKGARCPVHRSDCDGNPANRCEVDLQTDDRNCGGCGVRCEDAHACTGGSCERAYGGVAVGHDHACFLSRAGRVQCWGRNQDGELGRGKRTLLEPEPDWVQGLGRVSHLAAGNRSTCAVLEDGSVECWGELAESPRPVTIRGLAGVKRVSIFAGLLVEGACALLGDGSVRCWGNGYNGQLVPGRKAHFRAPKEALPPNSARAVATGGSQSCAIRLDGSVACWGTVLGGQGGPHVVPVDGVADAVEIAFGLDDQPFVRLADGKVVSWGPIFAAEIAGSGEGPALVPGFSETRSLAMGGAYQCATTALGPLCRGFSTQSVRVAKPLRGLGDAPGQRIVAMAASTFHACALDASEGREAVWCMGGNHHGQLGNGEHGIHAELSPARVPNARTIRSIRSPQQGLCAINTAGDVSCWGAWSREPQRVRGIEGAERLFDGRKSSELCVKAKKPKGDLVCFASPTVSPLVVTDLGAIVDQAAWSSAKSEWVFAVKKGGGLLSWRRVEGGKAEKVDVPGLGDALQVSAGREVVCVARKKGKASCFVPEDPFAKPAVRPKLLDVDGLADVEEIRVYGDKVCARAKTGAVACASDPAGPRGFVLRAQPDFSPALSLGSGNGLCARRAGDVPCHHRADGGATSGDGVLHVGQTFTGAALEVTRAAGLTCVVTSTGARCNGRDPALLGVGHRAESADPVAVRLAAP